MKASQRDTIQAAMEAYKRFDLGHAVARAYPEQTDLSDFTIGSFSAENLILYASQVAANFEEVFRSGLWVSIPGQAVDGARRVDYPGIAQQFATAVEQSALDQVSTLLAQLIAYQMDHGFWRMPAPGSAQYEAGELKQLAERIRIQTKRLEDAQKFLDQLLAQIESERAGLNAFTTEKKGEFEEVRRMVAEAKQHLNTITASLEDAKKKEAALGEIEGGGKKVVENLNVELGVVKKELDAFKTAAGELQGKLTTDAAEAHQTMDQAKQLYEFVKGKEQEIIRLTGMAADGSMGNKFNTRSGEIGSVLWWWRWAVPVSAVLSIGWVIAVFVCYPSTTFDAPWANFMVNLLKTAPAFVLVGFVMAQYSKERNLREDYAFKAAVAMTITAYADLLNERDTEKNASRQKLILQALERVHTPPKLHSEKGGTLFSWRAKELRGTLEQLNESVKGIKDAVKP